MVNDQPDRVLFETGVLSAEQTLRLSREKYRLALDQSGNVIIEYEPNTGSLSFSENCADVLDLSAEPRTTLEAFIKSGAVPKEFCIPFKDLFECCVNKKQPQYLELQLTDNQGKTVWCAANVLPIEDDSGSVFAIVGRIRTLGTQKIPGESSPPLSDFDPLTGILNRVVMEKLVNDSLENPENNLPHGLMIFDIDYFKQVNDTYGHSFGDEVLVSVVNIVKSVIPEDALFARMGGDEFLLFAPETPFGISLLEMAADIIRKVRENVKQGSNAVTISIGLAFSDSASRNFYTLYKNADIALYRAKANGRDCFEVF